MNHPGDQEVERARDELTIQQVAAARRWYGENRNKFDEFDVMLAAYASSRDAERIAARGPIPVVIDCPVCGCGHVDKGEWATKPHKTHLCESCGHEWRPFPVATVGIQPHDFPARIAAYADASQKSLVAELVKFVELVCSPESAILTNADAELAQGKALLARAREGAKP